MVNLGGSVNAVRRSFGDLMPRRHHRVSRVTAALGRLLAHWPVRLVVFLMPTLLAATYYFAIASGQYRSEAHFVVRSQARPDGAGGLSFLVQLGLMKSQDDSFIVQDYIGSRDALTALAAAIPLKEMYDREGTDFLARYPSILYGPSEEKFFGYYKRMVSAIHADRTGITSLTVDAFRPEDAHLIAETLLKLSEELVNKINRRLQTDAIASSLSELKTAQARVIDAQSALTEFRNREMIVDPQKSAVALAELIARFSEDLAATQVQIAELKIGSSSGPQMSSLQRKATALTQQIAEERSKIARDEGGLASRIAAYERLVLEREFANRMLSSTESELVRARAEAARQLLYLERIVEPNLPDYATEPRRTRKVLTFLVINVLLLGLAWLVFSGVREHGTDGR